MPFELIQVQTDQMERRIRILLVSRKYPDEMVVKDILNKDGFLTMTGKQCEAMWNST